MPSQGKPTVPLSVSYGHGRPGSHGLAPRLNSLVPPIQGLVYTHSEWMSNGFDLVRLMSTQQIRLAYLAERDTLTNRTATV